MDAKVKILFLLAKMTMPSCLSFNDGLGMSRVAPEIVAKLN